MGKKEKFIDKANSQKFHLLHRSQRDEAHANYETPSNFVLVPAVDNGNNNSNNNGGGGRYEAPKRTAALKLDVRKDHINELGFANDGYDYSQHLRELGGGTFISKSGQTGAALDLAALSKIEGAAFELPDDCMPSEKNLDRHYEAITINHNLMDKDIRAALFDGFDDEGEFEELQDDFIAQVMEGPADDDFDFDAHIAKLIARSEQTLNIPNKDFRSRVRFAGDEGEEEFCSDDEFPDYLVDEADFPSYQQKGRGKAKRPAGDEDEDSDGGFAGQDAGASKGAVGSLSEEAREALELQFERTLAEYDDEEIGYLEELQEEDMGGTIDFNEDNNALEGVLDEFLQAAKDTVFAEGTKHRKGARSTIVVPPRDADGAALDADEAEGEVDIQRELQEQVELQEETEQVLLRMKRDAANKDTSIETCQAYLQEVRIEEEWDCESILSTYSTLDNHPTLIKDTNKKFRKYKSPHERSLDAAAAFSAASSAGSVASRSMASRSKAGSSIYGTSAALTAKGPASTPGKIVLSGRLNLPEGFGPTAYEKRKELPQRSLDSTSAASVAGTASAGGTRGRLTNIKEEKEEEEEEGSSDSDEEGEKRSGSESEDGERKHGRSAARKRRQETPEEKKARKEAVKLERRAKRSSKKELKNTFREEGTRMIRSVGNEQSTDHVSVFRYT